MDSGIYMRRALYLARHGELHASPNPMVGAVIVADGRIIGEGWHRRCGEAHAEVNAVSSVAPADRPLLAKSTMYVTLEPCAHYGKTPPCARLIIDTGIPRVVVATLDPFEKVSGRGVDMLREAGVDVQTGMLGDEARALNRRFFAAHTRRRPYVTLKWALSADGFIDGRGGQADPAARISTPLTTVLVHRERACNDAVLCGSGTFLSDSPSMTVREYAGASPRPYVCDRRHRSGALPDGWTALDMPDVAAILKYLYNNGVTSLLVEGGRGILCAFLDSGLYDEIRVEQNPALRLGRFALKTPAPEIGRAPDRVTECDGNLIYSYVNPAVAE